MLTTGMMTTALFPASAATTLAIGPLALLAFASLAAVAVVLVAGAATELRRPTASGPRLPFSHALQHTA